MLRRPPAWIAGGAADAMSVHRTASPVRRRARVPARIGSLAALAALGLVLAVTPGAYGHVRFVSSSPRAGAALAKPPAVVTVTFASEIRRGTLRVLNGAGAAVSTGVSGRDPRDVRRLRVALKPRLTAKRFVVYWTAKAPDGHTQSGHYSFRVR